MKKNKSIVKVLLIFLCVLFCFITNIINSQSKVDEFRNWNKQNKNNSDTLLLKTYRQLESSFLKYKQDSFLSKIYANGYLKKAKKEKDSLRLANGYYYISKICDDNLLINYLDSIILVSKNLKNVKYPGVGYLNKGVYYYHKEDYNKALENYLIAQKYAKNNNNTLLFITI